MKNNRQIKASWWIERHILEKQALTEWKEQLRCNIATISIIWVKYEDMTYR